MVTYVNGPAQMGCRGKMGASNRNAGASSFLDVVGSQLAQAATPASGQKGGEAAEQYRQAVYDAIAQIPIHPS